jgi:fructuronate reductase/mannitol 2-dehydrogenase
MPHHLLPSLHEALAEGRPHRLLTLAVAAWCRYLRGIDADGRPFTVDDPHAERLQQLARAGGTDPRPLLGERSIFGDLVEDGAFVARLTDTLEHLERSGVRATLTAALDSSERMLQ